MPSPQGLFRIAVALTQTFHRAVLVAAGSGREGTRTAGRTGDSLFARQPSAAHGTHLLRQPRPFRGNRAGRAGAANPNRAGKLDVPSGAGASGWTAGEAARFRRGCARRGELEAFRAE